MIKSINPDWIEKVQMVFFSRKTKASSKISFLRKLYLKLIKFQGTLELR